MGNSNQRKDATLGMPHGTANSRLRKNVLFSLLQKLGEDICFKCGRKIEKVEELSIEHKLPWEGRSADLFWDLSNIAFLICTVIGHTIRTKADLLNWSVRTECRGVQQESISLL